MSEDELDLRIRFLMGNYRNLIYYRSIDLSERSTYIHQVRGYRKKAVGILSEIPRNNSKYDRVSSFLNKIVASCNPKIKTEECTDWIMNVLSKFMEEYDG